MVEELGGSWASVECWRQQKGGKHVHVKEAL
jgi:hypothetical protein